MGCSTSLPFLSAIENIFLNRKRKLQNFIKRSETNSANKENGYMKDSMNGTIKNDNEIGEKIIYNSTSDTKSTELENIPIKDLNEKMIDETLHELASSTKEETLAEYKDRMKNELTKTISFDKTHTSIDLTEMQSNYSLKTTSTEPEIEQSFENNNPSNSINFQHTYLDFQKISSTAIMTKNLLSTTAPNEPTSKNTMKKNLPIYRPRSNRISSKPTKWEQRHDQLSRSGKKLHRRKSSLSIFSDDSTMFKKPHTLYLVFGNNFLKTPKIKIIESQKGSRWMIKPKQNISELDVYTGVKTLIGEEEIPSETAKKPKAIPKKLKPSESTKSQWNLSSKAVEKPIENNYLHKSTGIERKVSPTFDNIPSTNNLNLSVKEEQQEIIQKRWGAARENVNPIQKSQIDLTNTVPSSTRFISSIANNENDVQIEKLTHNKSETVSVVSVGKPQNSSLNNVRQTSNLSPTNTVSTRGSKAQNSLINVRKKSAIPLIKPNVVTVKNKNRLQTKTTETTSLTSVGKRTNSKLNSARQISNLSQANTLSSGGSKIRTSLTNIKKKSTGPNMKQNTITTTKNKSPSQHKTPTRSRLQTFKKENTSIPERKISPRPIFNVKQTSELNTSVNQALIGDDKNVSIDPEEKLLAPSKGLTIADIVNQTMKRKDSNETNSDSIRKEKAKLWLKSIQKNEKTNDKEIK